MLLLLTTSCAYDSVEKLATDPQPCTPPDLVTYTQHISPLLTKNCRTCHNAAILTGGVNLEDFAEIKRRADTGQLVGVVSHAPGYAQMPKDGAKLSDCDIALLKAWVTAGAPNN
ncbi:MULTISPECIES: c-type cytochrome [Hymenobacter]|uniref:c-type cytochrome n=1 Tax=Hymenobacter TaxID=89966 RepID=UPI001058B8AD|nr:MULTISPECIES: cytochrome c [Hymenobacter]QIL76314.1 cytochrome c [Hymenobacter sp. HDW8]